MCVCGWESLKQTHRDKLLMGCTVQMHHCTLSLIRRRTEGGNRGRKGTESLEDGTREWKKKLMHCRNFSICISSLQCSPKIQTWTIFSFHTATAPLTLYQLSARHFSCWSEFISTPWCTNSFWNDLIWPCFSVGTENPSPKNLLSSRFTKG